MRSNLSERILQNSAYIKLELLRRARDLCVITPWKLPCISYNFPLVIVALTIYKALKTMRMRRHILNDSESTSFIRALGGTESAFLIQLFRDGKYLTYGGMMY